MSNIRGLSALGLLAPLEGPGLGGGVTTLSAGYGSAYRPFATHVFVIAVVAPALLDHRASDATLGSRYRLRSTAPGRTFGS
jgi:hypothetical protein